jgi:hypothetical protein
MNLILTSVFRAWLWCCNAVHNEILSSEIRKARNPLFCCVGTHFELHPLKWARENKVAHAVTSCYRVSPQMCVYVCGCVNLLSNIQRDSTCTSKRQIGFQIYDPKSMEQIYFREANCFSVNRFSEVLLQFLQEPATGCYLSHMNSFHTLKY